MIALGPAANRPYLDLAVLEKALRDSGLLHRGSDGALRLSPRAVRQLGRALLRDTAEQLADRPLDDGREVRDAQEG